MHGSPPYSAHRASPLQSSETRPPHDGVAAAPCAWPYDAGMHANPASTPAVIGPTGNAASSLVDTKASAQGNKARKMSTRPPQPYTREVPLPAHLADLNPAQRLAATTPAPLLVLAGAGSGKTETLIRRVADLILTGEAPDRLLCITFTAKAANEMRSRLAARLGERTPRWIGTFHAVMARLLIEDGAGVPGLPRGFAILGQRDARALLMKVTGMRDTKAAGLLLEAVSLLKNGLVTDLRHLPRGAAVLRFASEELGRAAALLPAYQAALAQRQALDFDDLIARPVMAMRADPALANPAYQPISPLCVDRPPGKPGGACGSAA